MTRAEAERLPDVEDDSIDVPDGWSVCVHEGSRWEVSVCHSENVHGFRSFGWFGADKIEVLARSMDEAKQRAKIIADAFNSNGIGYSNGIV